MNITRAGNECGLPPKTIRYYEEIGLVSPHRRANGYRDYGDGDVHKLRFLARARGLGFTIEECRQLL
ncbi:MAG: MerR family transcriptional regulator, partial [Nitratireductor sp.]|nr:MerR family transcriptional regulator [Nitratireductor sp.]